MLGADPEFIVAESGAPVPAPEGLPFEYDPPLVELNIAPASSPSEFVRNVKVAVEELRDAVDIWPHEAALLAYDRPHVGFAKYAYRHGRCAPEAPLSRRREGELMWHYAGGHLHFSYEADIPPQCMALLCDLYIGLPTAKYDPQVERRKIFGWPGLYRETSYGIEYRTLSNRWAMDTMLLNVVAERAFKLLDELDTASAKVWSTDWRAVHSKIVGAAQ